MTRTLLAIAALAVAVAAPASAYTPNPEDPYYPKKPFPCINCGVKINPGIKYINPGLKYRLLGSRLDKVALNPQPLPPKALGKIVR